MNTNPGHEDLPRRERKHKSEESKKKRTAMKKITLLASVAILGLLTAKVEAGDPALPTGPANFKLSAMMPNPNSFAFKTNKNSTSTNITTTTKSSFGTKSVMNKDMLKLLANSLTNLPPAITNGQLVTDGEGDFFVVLSNATFNVSSVLSMQFDEPVFNGSEAITRKVPPGTKTSETESLTANRVATLTYYDSSQATGDGKHTSITFHGLLATKYGDKSLVSFTTSFTLTGQGDGIVDGNFVVLTGTVTGNITGSVDLDDIP
jgi:hypothetical protein